MALAFRWPLDYGLVLFKCFASHLVTLLSSTLCIDELLIKVNLSAQPRATVQMM